VDQCYPRILVSYVIHGDVNSCSCMGKLPTQTYWVSTSVILLDSECSSRHYFAELAYMDRRGRVSKYATNGSKRAVIAIIGFLCVSLGSSTVQLHDSLGRRRACECSEARFNSQIGDRASSVYYWGARCCAFFVRKINLCIIRINYVYYVFI
jgi:hypothetical protein